MHFLEQKKTAIYAIKMVSNVNATIDAFAIRDGGSKSIDWGLKYLYQSMAENKLQIAPLVDVVHCHQTK